MAARLTGNEADSEDLLQDLITKLFRQQKELAALDDPGTWLKRALYNQYVDSYRRARHRPTSFTELAPDGEANPLDFEASPDAGPESLAERDQTLTTLQAAIDTLSENQRALILLHDVEGMTLTELAAILREPLGTLKSRLHRARRALRETLRGGTF